MGILDVIKKIAKQTGDIERSKSQKGGKPEKRRINDSEYQKNYDYFINKECPYCQFQLKQVVKKGNCPSCKKTIISERHFDSKKQMLMTKEQAEKLAIEIKHYQDLKWAVEVAEELELSPREIGSMVKSTQINTKFSVLWVKANDLAMRHARQAKWLSFRNTRLIMGDIVYRDGHLKKALDFYLAVCFIDLNGPDDAGTFDLQRGSLKPRVLHSIRNISNEMNIDDKALKELYISAGNLEKNRFMPLSPEETWGKFLNEYTKKK